MSEEWIGTEVGGYQLTHRIGEGGNGIVFRAIHLKTQKVAAIKIMIDSNSSLTSGARLFEEARIIRQINHPNIVELIDFQTLPDDRPALIMEYLQGESLDKYLKVRRRLHSVEALEICIPVCDALEAAHQKGIVHRDLKPDNVFLCNTPKGRQIKLLDFGIAKFQGPEGGRRITKSGVLLGTPQYMSPEQANRPREVDGRSDLYSIGVILYEMVTGKLPFDSENAVAILFLHYDQDPLPPSRHTPGLSLRTEKAILRCLAKLPSERYPSAAVLAKDLREILSFERFEALKRTRSAPSPEEMAKIKEISAPSKPQSAPLPEDDATTFVAEDVLEPVLELEAHPPEFENTSEDAKISAFSEMKRTPFFSKPVSGLRETPNPLANQSPEKTTEENAIKPFSRQDADTTSEGSIPVFSKQFSEGAPLPASRFSFTPSVKDSQELTQPKATPSQELARLVLRAKENATKPTPSRLESPWPKARPKTPEESPPTKPKQEEGTRLASKPSALKPNAEDSSKIRVAIPKPPEPSKLEPGPTKTAIPSRPNQTSKRKSYETPAPPSDDEDVITSAQNKPESGVIRAVLEGQEGGLGLPFKTTPDLSVPIAALMAPAPSEPPKPMMQEETVALRLHISPPEAQVVYWINEEIFLPEKIPQELLVPKRAVIEIAAMARGHYPKQIMISALVSQEITLQLDRPSARLPTPMRGTPIIPPGTKR